MWPHTEIISAHRFGYQPLDKKIVGETRDCSILLREKSKIHGELFLRGIMVFLVDWSVILELFRGVLVHPLVLQQNYFFILQNQLIYIPSILMRFN